jgi:serine kinase of HPr protein (carbohydrate metabolism regulator)
MTDRFSPRRNLDHFLASKLNSFIGQGSDFLFVFNIDSSTESKFSIEEFNNFKKAVSILVNDASIQYFVISESDYLNFLGESQDDSIYNLILLFNFNSIISGKKSEGFFKYLCKSNPNILFFSEKSVDISLQNYLYNKFISSNSYKNISYTGYFHDVLDLYTDNSIFYISK